MAEVGFVKLSRKMISWGWFKDVNTAHLFLYCLMRANYKDTEWRGVRLRRGSFVTSLRNLSEETGLTLQQTRTALEHLISTQEITKRSSFKNTVIIVNNYDKYQNSNTKSGKKTTKFRQGSNKAATTDKKEKKYSSPHREKNTSHAPERPDGVGLVTEEKPVEEVSVEEFLCFTRSVPGGDDYTAGDFYTGFESSHTCFPPDWQDVFIRFAAASGEAQNQFLDDLTAGAYREKWGCVD